LIRHHRLRDPAIACAIPPLLLLLLLLLLMQRNVACLSCMAFVLGIQAADDYGRAPWNEGLYFRFIAAKGRNGP
jgi:hypothetical protein